LERIGATRICPQPHHLFQGSILPGSEEADANNKGSSFSNKCQSLIFMIRNEEDINSSGEGYVVGKHVGINYEFYSQSNGFLTEICVS
jgi:hypothetical protein